MNKWKNGAIPALLIHGCIGTVYCWSLFSDAIAEKIGSSYGWAFSLAIFFLGLSAAFLGPFVERNVRKAAYASTIFFGSGMLLSGLACMLELPFLFYLGYGVIMGIGLGLGYLSPVKTLMLWFKDNKGLATGIAISGFGVAKVFATPTFSYILDNYGVSAMFFVHGVVYIVIMSVASSLLKKPIGTESLLKDFNVKLWLEKLKEVVLLPKLWVIWFAFFLNITAGLAIISHEKVLFNAANLTQHLSICFILCAVFNTLGRFCVSWSSDFVSNRVSIFLFILAISAASCFITYIPWLLLIPFSVLLCNAGYGAMFATMPCALSDRYGIDKASEVHGVILSAWAFAGLCGNQIASYAVQFGPQAILLAAGLLYLIGFIILKLSEK